MEEFEKFQLLGRGIKVKINRVHRFSTDAVLLADFAAPKKDDIACDLGTGCGIIPLLWCRLDAPKHITAVDIQPDAIHLLHDSIRENSLESRIDPLQCDLKQLPSNMNAGYTLVTMNPPYKTADGGVRSADTGRLIARHEIACNLDDIVKAASGLLRFGGRLCMCHRPERLCDLMSAMRQYGVEPKYLRLVCQREGCEPNLILAEGRKGAHAGLRIGAPLYIEKDSAYSPEMREIYKYFNETEEDAR